MFEMYLKKISEQLISQQCWFCESRVSIFDCSLCEDCRDAILSTARDYRVKPALHALSGMRACSPFSELLSIFHYDYPIDRLLKSLKFNGDLTVAPILASLLIPSLETYYQENQLIMPTTIIPMPLHRERWRERGFNQSFEIVKPIAQHFSIHIDTKCIMRNKITQAQAQLSKLQRKQNVKNAFMMTHSSCAQSNQKRRTNHTAYFKPKPEPIDTDIDIDKAKPLEFSLPESVIVFDDVITTGHTLVELCHTLKNAGVHNIHCWSIALS